MTVKIKPESVKEFLGRLINPNVTEQEIEEATKILTDSLEVVVEAFAKELVRQDIITQVKSEFRDDIAESITKLMDVQQRLNLTKIL